MVASGFYQAAILPRQPVESLTWIAGMIVLFSAVVLLMRRWAQRGLPTGAMAGQEA